MHWLDWSIVGLSLVITGWIAFKTQHYVKSVADFLSAGRVAGRYVLCVSGAEASMGLISLVAIFESYYASGFAYSFWSAVSSPIFIVLGLVGFCVYRYRETRAMTLGQFFEMRYSRNFRVFAGILQSISGIVNYALFPAVGARFLVYFCNLPIETHAFGMVFPTFALVMAAFLSIAVILATLGGQLTIMTTDCVQGILSYPMYVVVVGYILLHYSWFDDMAPAMLDRAPGHSFLNPFDIGDLPDFNLFYVLVGILGGVINRLGWQGNQGYGTAAKNAHEQKIAAVLGSWRSGFSNMMYVLLAVVAFAYLNNDKYREGPNGADAIRTEVALKALDDVVSGERLAPVRQEVSDYLKTGHITPEMQALLDKTAAIKASEEATRKKIQVVSDQPTELAGEPNQPAAEPAAPPPQDDPAKRQAAREAKIQVAQDAIRAVDPGVSQTYSTIFGQMRVPMAIKYILPVGITGMFCAICVMLLISTDISYQHSWGSILVQDIILPFRKKPFTPRQHLTLLRWMILFVAVFSFFFSYFFGQVDYILMFFAITGAIWLGGSGPCIVFGLYWKRGTTSASWVALITGSTIAVGAILLQKYWVPVIYPWLYEHNMVDSVAYWLQTISRPFEPLIKWRMDSEKFPINSQELYFISMVVSLGSYIIISLLTCREPFNMDRMLHRGKYHREGQVLQIEPTTWRNFIPKLIGIDNQYTRGDKILAWSVFLYSFGFGFVFSFLVILIWNWISPWSNHGWSWWFYINNFLIAGVIGVVSTVWFTIGGTIDLFRLFRDLRSKEVNVLDDGRVIGHVSADDLAMVEQVDHFPITGARVEEEMPGKEKRSEQDDAAKV